jgi:hypothetical protein
VSGDHVDLRRMFAEGVRCAGGRRGVVYVTVAITSGYRFFQLLDEMCCTGQELASAHEERFRNEVIQPNSQDAESWAEQARNSFPGRVVLDPSRLVMSGWAQHDYNSLWDSIIDEFVDIVVATPRWAFSRGARKEIEKAIRTARKVVDLTGTEIPVAELLQHDERAREELRSWGWSADRIDTELPPLDIEAKSDEYAPSIDTAWPDAFSWVHRDLNDYMRERGIYTPDRDDARTRLGLTDEKGWGPQKLKPYWSMVLDRSVTTNVGRVELGSLVGASVAMLRSVWRVTGPLTAHSDMRNPGWHQRQLRPLQPVPGQESLHLGQIETDVWSWIQLEHSEMRRDHTSDADDERTRELAAGDPGGWVGELWREYWDYAVHLGIDTQKGKHYLGKFVVGTFRLFESTVRLYEEPRRVRRDISRSDAQEALATPSAN